MTNDIGSHLYNSRILRSGAEQRAGMMARGRPTKYDPAYAEGARRLAMLGATDQEVADFYAVDVATIYRWKIAHADFCESLRAGKQHADARVERSLYQRACGYEQEAVKIFMPAGRDDPVIVPYRERIAPDTTAAVFWLKNRRPAEWRDKHEVSGALTVTIANADADL